VDQLILATVFLVTLALGAVLAKVVLSFLLRLITDGGLPVAIRWRPVVFISALFWFWYLTPAIAESPLAARVLLVLAR
jgi:hypothetical protein